MKGSLESRGFPDLPEASLLGNLAGNAGSWLDNHSRD